jgi:F-type H+-transporting ATPase subunit gamma
MASGKDLRRRIASVKSTQQITKAMKMVSAARLRRAQEAIVSARPFATGIHNVVSGLAQDAELRESHELLVSRPVKKVNVILLTSDRGLCGNFNGGLVKRAESLYKEESSKFEKIAFTCMGRKGFDYLSHRKIPVHKNYLEFYKDLKYAKVAAIADELSASFLSGEFDEIRIIFAEFKSAISQVPLTEVYLPVSVDGQPAGGAADFLFEPNANQILREILPRYLKVRLYKAVLESLASEHGARMAAMENATKNAGEMIRKLTLEYNKIRQAGITKELLEIVSGAEALK